MKMYWFCTIHWTNLKKVEMALKEMENELSYAILGARVKPEDGGDYHNLLMLYQDPVQTLPTLFKQRFYQPLQIKGGNWKRTVENTIQHIKKMGEPTLVLGQPPLSQNTNLLLLNKIKQGTKRSELIALYPSMVNVINKLIQFRPPRTILTHVLYIWGSTGVGKTTMIYRILATLRKLGISDFYSKMGGLSKFYDGYDNQDIVWIDDPVKPDAKLNTDAIQQLKTMMSTGDIICEIKGGSMVHAVGGNESGSCRSMHIQNIRQVSIVLMD
jgi:hypothetical protein